MVIYHHQGIWPDVSFGDLKKRVVNDDAECPR